MILYIYCNKRFTITDRNLEYCFIYMNVYSKHLCLFIIRPTKSTTIVWKVVNKLTLIVTNVVVVWPLWPQRALYSNAFQLQIQHNCRKRWEIEPLRTKKKVLLLFYRSWVLVAHMTKRRAENILPPEIPHKRCFRSLSDNDKPVGGVNVIQNAIPFSLLTLAGQRCRKRPSYLEDSLDTDNLPRKVAANRVNSELTDRNTCKSRTFEDDAGRPVTRRSSRALQTQSNKQTDEENNITAGHKVKFHTKKYKHLSAKFKLSCYCVE